MASAKVLTAFQFLVIFSLYLVSVGAAISFGLPLPDIRNLRRCNIDKIYQFGASKADTGNCKIEDPSMRCNRLPYGESLFQEPTGRCSDGLLMIDCIALAAGIPFLNPYLKVKANFSHGVNFAVGGSTALSESSLAEKNISIDGSNSSLGVQLEWMSDYLMSHHIMDVDWKAERLKNALFIVGETGGNDYFYALMQGKTIEEAQVMVHEVVESIMDAVRKVIVIGAVRIIVPGNFPLGCFPVFLTFFQSNNSKEYNEHQCLKGLNHLTAAHNNYLQHSISLLQEENPNTTIVYGDYYNAFKWLLNNGPHMGFDATSTFKACCGTGGSYSFSASNVCGNPDVPVCPDPDQYIHWDGIHLTQNAQSVIATWLVADIIPRINCDLQVL